MGNCQAAEAATVVIQHPGTKTERVYWSVSANEIMNSNPGHYVALVLTTDNSNGNDNGGGMPMPVVKQLKLLRPADTLLIGRVYRLISFEDVLKEFAANKSTKLGRLLKESGGLEVETKNKNSGGRNPNSERSNYVKRIQTYVGDHLPEVQQVGLAGGSSRGGRSSGRRHNGIGDASSRTVGVGQWRPALQSIAELAS